MIDLHRLYYYQYITQYMTSELYHSRLIMTDLINDRSALLNDDRRVSTRLTALSDVLLYHTLHRLTRKVNLSPFQTINFLLEK